MTFRGLLSDAREAARLEGTLRRVKREYARDRGVRFPLVDLLIRLIPWAWAALPGALALLPGGPLWTKVSGSCSGSWHSFSSRG